MYILSFQTALSLKSTVILTAKFCGGAVIFTIFIIELVRNLSFSTICLLSLKYRHVEQCIHSFHICAVEE
jgi:hypothetical protein